MKKVSKLFALGMAAVMGASIMLTGCGAKKDDAAKSTSTQAEANSPKELKELTVWGVIDPQVSAQQIIADKKGFFEEQGLKVTNKLVQSGTEIGPMIAGGSAPISFESNYTDISLASNNVGVKILAPVANIGGTQCVVARKGLNITKAKDLEGKKIGMASGSGVLIAIRKMCGELGVDINKITFVNLAPADQVAAMEKGDIDAMACWEPWVGKAVAQGGTFLFSGTKSELPDKKGDVSWLNFHTTIQVTDKFLKEDPETLVKFLTAVNKATDFINNNREEAADILSAELKIDKTELLGIMSKNEYSNVIDDKFVSGTNELADFMLEMKNIKTKPDINTFTDYSILEKVNPELVKVK